ncbi:MAG TPA: NUDIX domain-containing protein [Anaerolineales bacterium]|nr:NUDIX domain-containing protein [Anaerolineales bacterium]
MSRVRFPVTVHLLLFQDNKVLLLRRYNTGFRDGEYSVPAGHLDGGETVVEAAAREAEEEIGVRIEADDIQFSSVMHRMEGDERVDFFVRIQKWDGQPYNAEPDKCDDLRWVEVDALPGNIIPYITRAIGNHFNGVKFDEAQW